MTKEIKKQKQHLKKSSYEKRKDEIFLEKMVERSVFTVWTKKEWRFFDFWFLLGQKMKFMWLSTEEIRLSRLKIVQKFKNYKKLLTNKKNCIFLKNNRGKKSSSNSFRLLKKSSHLCEKKILKKNSDTLKNFPLKKKYEKSYKNYFFLFAAVLKKRSLYLSV